VAAATTPAPLPASESADQAHDGSGSIPGDRPEFPLPTLDDKHKFLTTPGSIDRPRTPPELSFEDSRALLTRLTGLQPWQLEAFPDELPPLPLSRPSSPLRSPETSRPPPQVRARRLSTTAVPIRFRKPPTSPSVQREGAADPEKRAVSPGHSPVRPRHIKAPSAEFITSREIRPLYLLERNRKSNEIDELLPALPSSASPSRASSTTDTDAEYESALESPRLSSFVTPDERSFDPLHAVSDLIASRPGPEQQHPELADREIEEVDGSGQVTPKASDFPSGVSGETNGPARDVLAAALEDVKAKSSSMSPRPASPLAPSAPLDDTKMRENPTARSGDASPTKTSSRLQTAAFGAAIGGLTAAALRNRTPSPFEVLSGGRRLSGEQKRELDFAGAPSAHDDIDIDFDNKDPAQAEPLEKTPDAKQFIPTFVDNEDDWSKNKTESVATDDATLIAEPTSAVPVSKEIQTEKILETTAPQAGDSVEVRRAELAPTVLSAIALKEDLEKTLADIRPELEPVQPAQEEAASATPKGKKTKKNKKGKRGSQQAGAEPSSLPEVPTQDDQILSAPETQQEAIEREILEPSFGAADAEKKVNAMDFLEKVDQPTTLPSEASPPTGVQTEEPVIDTPAPVQEPPTLTAKDIQESQSATDDVTQTQEPERPTSSGWGNSLWGALGWGKKRATSPTPSVESKKSVTASVMEEKRDLQVPPPPVVPVEAKQVERVPRASDLSARDEPAREIATSATEKPTPETTTRSAFVVPQTAYFADSGKPHFTPPQLSFKSTEKLAQEPVEDIATENGLDSTPQAKTTQQTVLPQTTFFTDDGKPHFTFPQSSTKDVADSVQMPSAGPENTVEDVPEISRDVAQVTSSAYAMPQTAFFTDNGKPHFTFPQPSTEIAPEPASVTVDDAVAAAEPSESKKKKSKKDQKKRESVAAPVEAETSITAEAPAEQQIEPELVPEPDVVPEQVPEKVLEASELSRDITPMEVSIFPEPSAPVAPALEEDIAASPSKKTKSKKTKKAKQESAPITPVVEQSLELPSTGLTDAKLDAGIDVPLPIETLQEKEELAELASGVTESLPTAIAESTTVIEDATQFAPSTQDDPVRIERELLATVPIVPEDDTSVTPKKKKKSKKVKSKSGTQTPDVQVEPVTEAPAPFVEPSAASQDVLDIPTQAEQRSEPTVSELTEVKPFEEPETTVAQAQAPELDSTPKERVQLSEDATTLGEPSIEAETAYPAAKKDKKKKKGKKVKDTETPGENVQSEIPTAIEIPAESVTKPEEIGLPREIEGELETPAEEVGLPVEVEGELETPAEEITTQPLLAAETRDPVGARDLLAPVEIVEVVPQRNAVVEPTARDIGDGPAPALDQKTPAPVILEPTNTAAQDDFAVPTPSKKDKKKKGKKSKAVDDSEPVTPVAEVQRELETPLESVRPGLAREPVRPASEQVVEAVAHPEPPVDVAPVAEDQTIVAPAPVEPVIEAPTPVEGETGTSRKAKKKKVKKGKSVDAELSVADVTIESAPIVESSVEIAPTARLEEPQEVPLPLEIPGELVPEPVEEPQEVPLPLEIPGELVPEPVEEPQEVPLPLEIPGELVPEPIEEPQEVPLPLETPGELVPQPIEDTKEAEVISTPVLAESTREIEQPIVEESAEATSKKSKKKKAKKAKSTDITEPSTPIIEEPAIQFETSAESLVVEKTEDVPEVLQQAHVAEKETPLPEETEFTPELVPVSRAIDSTQPIVAEEPAQDFAVSTSIEPTVETGDAELTSKKAKKKKAKKAKSTDITEPSTPVNEERSMQFEVLAEPVVEQNIDELVQPLVEAPTNADKPTPAVVEPLADTVVKDQQNVILPAPEVVAQDATEPTTLLEPTVEDKVAEPSSKKAKKNKDKKAKAAEEKEPETKLESVADVPAVDATLDTSRVEDFTQPSEPLSEAPAELVATANDPLSTPVVEEPIERELAIEMGGLSEPVDFEVPTGDPTAQPEVLQEVPSNIETATQSEESALTEEATPTSKKAKKKKAKKDKSVSEPQTPTTEVESFIPATSVVPDVEPISASVQESVGEQDIKDLVPEVLLPIADTEEVERTTTEPLESAQIAEEPIQVNEASHATPNELVEQKPEDSADATLSKKGKKKAKKSKRVSIVEDTVFMPTIPVEEPSRELELQDLAASVPLPEAAAVSEQLSPKSMSVDVAQQETDLSSRTLDDNNVAQPLVSVETERSVDSQAGPSQEAEDALPISEPVQPTEEEIASSKKSKKKVKKEKRKSVVDTGSSTPLETPTQELERAPLDEQPAPVPEIVAGPTDEAVSTAVDLQPANDIVEPEQSTNTVSEVLQEAEPTIEPVISESPQQLEQTVDVEETPLSKKDKKKAKKSKRVSIAEPESTSGTPAEEKASGPSIEEQTVPVTQLPEPSHDEAVSSSIEVQPASIPEVVEETEAVSDVLLEQTPQPISSSTEETPQSQDVPEEESTSITKKDKKAAKKAKRVSIADPESTPATPSEEKTEGESSVEGPQIPAPAAEAEASPEVALPEETHPRGLSVEEPATSAPVTEELNAASAPTDEAAATPVEEEPTAALTKKDKKKAKKAKRGSVAESETATPIETPTEEKSQDPLDAGQILPTPVTEEQAQELATVEEPASVLPVAEEPLKDVQEVEFSTAAKKEKKKAKKVAKRVSIAEPELSERSTSLEHSLQESTDLKQEDQPGVVALTVDESVIVAPTGAQPAVALTKDTEPELVEPVAEQSKDVSVEDLPRVAEESIIIAPSGTELEAAPTASEEAPKAEAQEEVTSAPLSKKDKNKTKKSKRGSIAEAATSEPATPVEEKPEQSFHVVAPAIAEEQKPEEKFVQEEVVPTQTVVESKEEPIVAAIAQPLPESAGEPSVTEPFLAEPPSASTKEEPIPTEAANESVVPTVDPTKDDEAEPAEWANLSKAQRKKLKKAKRASVTENEQSQPATPAEELSKELGVEDEQPTVEATEPPATQKIEEPSVVVEQPEPAPPVIEDPLEAPVQVTVEAPVEAPVEVAEEAPVKSKKDKKKKKSKAGAVAEGELSQPATPTEEISRELAEPVESVTGSAIEDVKAQEKTVEDTTTAVTVETAPSIEALVEPIPVANDNAEATLSKKDKKKKKSKAAAVVEGEASQPATPTEEASRELAEPVAPVTESTTVDLGAEENPVEGPATAPTVAAEPSIEPSVEPTPIASDTAEATLSKKDKKKAKKAKRASGIEDQPSLPATPVEEVAKELSIQDLPLATAPILEPVIAEPSAADDTLPPDKPLDQATTPAEPVEESTTKPSKKDKKKAKKAKQSSTETVPFLALETPEEANVSDTQSSPPHSIPSETPLFLSGIPTSYPHVRDVALVENGGEKEMEKENERVAGEEKMEEGARVEADVVGEKEKEKEPNVEVEQLVVAVEQDEPVMDDVVVETWKKNKKDKKGKKRASIAEEPTLEATTAVDAADTTTTDLPLTEQVEPAEEVITKLPAIVHPDTVLPELPIEQLKVIEAQVPEVKPSEQSEVVPSEPTVAIPVEPEQKKVKKHKLAAMFEQTAAEEKPVFSRKRAPLSKPDPQNEITSPADESSKEVKLTEDVVPAQIEPAISTVETEKPSEDIATSQDVVVEPIVPEPKPSEETIGKPIESTERIHEPAEELPSLPATEAPLQVEDVPEAESSLSKKEKKKNKKSKKQSGIATPIEPASEAQTVPTEDSVPVITKEEEPEVTALIDREVLVEAAPVVQLQPTESPLPAKLADVEPEVSSTVERDALIEAKDQPQEASAGARPQSTIPTEPVKPILDEPLETTVDVQNQSEPQPLMEEEAAIAPSKKDKKKNKKAKKQSGSATPAEELVPETQQGKVEEVSIPIIEQPTSAAQVLPIIEAATPSQQPPVLGEEEHERALENLDVEFAREEVPPVVVEPVIEGLQQEVEQPTIDASTEATEGTADDSTTKPSKKDKKKAKKVAEADTPATEDAPEVEKNAIQESTEPPALTQDLVPEPVIEPALQPPVEQTQPVTIEEVLEAPQQARDATTTTELVQDTPTVVENAPEAVVEPVQPAEDWGYTAPKKDKKKSKKVKKSDVVESASESVPQLPVDTTDLIATPATETQEEPQKSMDTEIALGNATVEYLPAESLPVNDLADVTASDSIDPDLVVERAPEGTTTDIAETVPLPPTALPVEASLEEQASVPISKKDKKKSKKAKKASGTATPTTEEAPMVQSEPKEELATNQVDPVAEPIAEAPASAPREDLVAEQPREPELVEPESSSTVAPAPSVEEQLPTTPSTKHITEPTIETPVIEETPVLQAETTHEPKIDTNVARDLTLDDKPVAAPEEVQEDRDIEPLISAPDPAAALEPALEDASVTAVSKRKNKRKSQKSGPSTPAIEDAPLHEAEHTRELEIQPEASSAPVEHLATEEKQVVVEHTSTPAAQTESVPEEQQRTVELETTMPPQTVEVNAPVADEPLPSTSKKSKKDKKKANSELATPVVDDVPQTQQEPVQEPKATQADVVANSETITTEPTRDVEPAETRNLQEADISSTPTAATINTQLEEIPLPASSSKKSKKKGKKSGTATPISEEVPQLLPEAVLPPVDEAATIDRNVHAQEEQTVEVPAKPMEEAVPSEPTVVVEPEVVGPVQQVLDFESSVQDTTARDEPITVPEPAGENLSSSSSKKKKKKAKKSEPQTPVVELIDLMDTQTSTTTDDVRQIPTTDVAETVTQTPVMETTAIETATPVETEKETVSEEKPRLSRKLSKKEKKALKESTARNLEAEPIVEVEVPVENVIEAPRTQEVAEVPVEVRQQAPIEETPQVSNPIVETDIARDSQGTPLAIDEPAVAPVDNQIGMVAVQDDATPSESIEQTEDVVKSFEPAVEDVITRDISASLPTSTEAAPSVEPSVATAPVDAPPTEEHVKQYIEQQPAPTEPEATVQPVTEKIDELATSKDTEPAEATTPLSRKASKKAKKGKKDKDATTSELTSTTEQLDNPLPTEPVVEDASSESILAEKTIETAAPSAPIDRELAPEPAAIDLPTYEVNEPVSKSTQPELESVPSTSETVHKATIDAPASRDVQPILDIGEAIALAKKSKKDKKKGKKSSSTLEVPTPIEVVPEPAVSSEDTISELRQPALIDELPRETQAIESEITVPEPHDNTAAPTEVAPTPIEAARQEIILPTQESTRELEPQSTEASVPDSSLISPVSKKDKKKKRSKQSQNVIDKIEAEPSIPATYVSEVPPVALEPRVEEAEILTTINEAKLEAAQSPAPPAFETHVQVSEPSNDVPPLDTATESARDIVKPLVQQDNQVKVQEEEQKDIVQPTVSQSPDLRAIQDEVADFKLRSEALDQALEASERLDQPIASAPTSLFDIVGKLSKKDKKKGKKARADVFESEPTTPAAEPEAAVEAKELVEEPAMTEVPLQKLSKKDKKKGKQSALTTEEPSEILTEATVTAVETQEPIIEQAREVEAVPHPTLSEPALHQEEPVVSVEEVVPTPLEEPIVPTKEDLATKETSRVDDTQMLDTETTLPVSSTEKQIIAESAAPAPEIQEPLIEEQPSLFRKLSKKDKKKQMKSALIVEDETMFKPKIDQPEPAPETRELNSSEEPIIAEPTTVSEEPSNAPIVPEVQETVVETERPSLSRKQSKKDKKKAKQSIMPEEPVDSGVETLIAPDLPNTSVEQPTVEIAKPKDDSNTLAEQSELTEKDFDNTPLEREVAFEIPNTAVTDVAVDTATLDSQVKRETADPVAQEEEIAASPTLTRKESKKDKKKGKSKIAEEPQPAVIQQAAVEQDAAPELAPSVTAENVAGDEWALPGKRSKKEKRKSKTTVAPEASLETEPTSISRDVAKEDFSLQPEEDTFNAPMPKPELVEPEPAVKASKKEKREYRKSVLTEEDQMATLLESEPRNVKDPVQEQPPTAMTSTDTIIDNKRAVDKSSASTQPPATSHSLETKDPPVLTKKPSRTHALAAMFEQGASQGSAAQRELRKGGTGSVKNLADQFETQSRSVTPVQLPVSRERSISRVTSDARLRPESPKKDIDFAGTIAAGLKASGFDDKYVVNDSTFHQSSSHGGIRDMTTDDDVAAALEGASSSKFAKRGWTTPTSSPKLRPLKESESDTLPPIEVAIASTDNASFDPLDVLNDPAFSKRNTSPGILEEADPDELGSKLKMNTRSKGKKKRPSLPESPAEALPKHLPDELTDTTSRSLEPEQQPMPVEKIEEDKKSRKPKKDKRAEPTQESVEYAAAETPVVEALTREHPAVETVAADSTTCERELKQTLPSDVETLDRSVLGELPTTNKESNEYPFPQVVTPDNTTSRSVEERSTRKGEEEREEVEEGDSLSKKKSKNSRKGKEKSESTVETERQEDPVRSLGEAQDLAHETHKRRSHPVTFEEDQPYEKRLHHREATPEISQATNEIDAGSNRTSRSRTSALELEPTTRGLSPSGEPTWSFAGIRDSAVEVKDSPVQASAPAFQESTRDSGYHDAGQSPVIPQDLMQIERSSTREKKRRSKEPKTPREKAIRNSQIIEDSPALPEYPTSAGVSTPGEYATKERTSYLFDSSPSTRAYGESPAVESVTPVQDKRRTEASSAKEASRSAGKSRKLPTETRDEQVSPTKEVEQKDPYQSIFGDPSEKAAEASSSLVTPQSKHGRTPSNKLLQTITETSPDDSPLNKKSRAINDVGAPDRGTKSLRRTDSSKSFTERLKSPPPVTPTPLSRKSMPAAGDAAGRNSPSADSPWHQVNDKVDRTMTLSPARRLPRSSPSFDPIKQHMAEQRSPSALSQRSMSNISKLRSPDQEQHRPLSSASNRSTHSLRRVDRSASGDLRSVARLGDEASAQDANYPEPNLAGLALATGASAAIAGIAAASKYDPVRGAGKGRRASMVAETFVSPSADRTVVAQSANEVQEAYGEAPRSPMSPTRPPSVRKRQSMQLIDLQSQVEQLAAQNSSLENAKARAEEILQAAHHQRQIDEQLVAEAAEARDREIHQRDIDIAQLKDTLKRLHEEIARLTEMNNTLQEANRNLINDTNERYAQLQSEGQLVQQQWQTSQRELEQLRTQHEQLTRGVEGAVRDEIGIALDQRDAEIGRLNTELSEAKEQVKTLQKQILASKKPSESFLTIRDEDYFDSACQQLCQHVQQWVLRFSKFSDTRPCRLSSEIAGDTRLDTATRQKIDTRLDNAILDGSDVDSLLADRVKRRDVFMSVVMTMIWEYVFTRYLFGMDREQRQKLKSLEKTLSEVGEYTYNTHVCRYQTNLLPGPPRAVAQWRAITLTLLSKRETFMQQRAQDTEAVVHEIYSTLSTLLSPPSHLQKQIQESLRNVMRLAVELSIEMRTQRAEYIMLPPLQPEYDTNGDLLAKVTFNASLMNERSGRETSNDELETRGAIVKIVLFPLVVKKGDDFGEGEDEIVVCPAQVLVQRPRDKKVVRMLSGAMSIDRPDSRASRMTTASRMTSVVPESSIMDYELGSGNVI
jgi:hypothetical protein